MNKKGGWKWALGAALVAVAAVAVLVWRERGTSELPSSFAASNGGIEAIEYDIATKQPGRIVEVLVAEGDMVESGQVLVRMDTAELESDLRQAEAELRQARDDKNQALAAVSQRESDITQTRASIRQRESEIKHARAAVSQRESEFSLAIEEFERAGALVAKDFIAKEQFNQAYSRKQTAEAALGQSQARKQAADATLALEQARLQSAETALRSARIQVAQRDTAIDAGAARIQKIKTIIDDSVLASPITGRVLTRLAEPGEDSAAGSKVLTVVDFVDVYMMIFLAASSAGRLREGAEARITIDAFPQYVAPATVSLILPNSQITPEVESEAEREMLMFRVKVKIDPDLLRKHLDKVRTGLTGIAYVRMDTKAPWPEHLRIRLPP